MGVFQCWGVEDIGIEPITPILQRSVATLDMIPQEAGQCSPGLLLVNYGGFMKRARTRGYV